MTPAKLAELCNAFAADLRHTNSAEKLALEAPLLVRLRELRTALNLYEIEALLPRGR